MPVKRRNHGRIKTQRGATNNVQCVQCGSLVAKDKAICKSSNAPVIEAACIEDLRKATVYDEPQVPTFFNLEKFCISCACHQKIVTTRSKFKRKQRGSSAPARVRIE